METGAITGHIDVAQLVLYAFWIFFAGLVFYLQRESRREGYPLVSEVDGRPMDHGAIWVPGPKTFLLADGSTVTVPRPEKDVQPSGLVSSLGADGYAFEPSGNPMIDGVGSASYAIRADVAEVTHDGHARMVPLRSAPAYTLEARDPDPRGMTVYGADHEAAGTVTDLWLDRADGVVRYFEVELPATAAHVLLPVNFTTINGSSRRINVRAILSSQFAAVPPTKLADLITLNEEERICSYYGGGYLYAEPHRRESWL
jgi:photosynthetic reaction center H subunit